MVEQNKIVPKHIAIIMDGNGRWAEQRGMDRRYGHAYGVESVHRSIKAAVDQGVEWLTLYTFSTENWGRPQEEVTGIMELFCESVQKYASELIDKGVRVHFIGDRADLSEKVLAYLVSIEEQTAHCQTLNLVFAFNYSSRAEITRAARDIAKRLASTEITEEQITEELLSQSLYTGQMPDPDLIVRTSGESRLSNFMLWQASYSEFVFMDVLWPDFDEDSFAQAIEAFAKKDRRFGLVK